MVINNVVQENEIRKMFSDNMDVTVLYQENDVDRYTIVLGSGKNTLHITIPRESGMNLLTFLSRFKSEKIKNTPAKG